MTTTTPTEKENTKDDLYLSVHTCVTEPLLICISKNQNERISSIVEQIYEKLGQHYKPDQKILKKEELKLFHLNEELDPSKKISEFEFPLSTYEHVFSGKSYRDAFSLYINTAQCCTLHAKLEKFCNDKDQTKVEFEGLTIFERRFMHSMASNYSIHHQSEGSGQNRRLILRKRNEVKIMQSIDNQSEKTSTENSIQLDMNGSKTPNEENSIPKKFKAKTNIPKGISTIVEGFLYLGSGRDANDIQELASLQISYIVNVTIEWPPCQKLPLHIQFKRISIKDTLDETIFPFVIDEMYEHLEQIKKSNKRVLVHCTMGKSRSAALVISYLMKSASLTLKSAFDRVHKARPIIQPNDNFMRQLFELEKIILKDNYTGPSMEWEFKALEEERRKRKLSEEKEKQQALLVKMLEQEHIISNSFLCDCLVESGIGQPELSKTADFIQFAMKKVVQEKKGEIEKQIEKMKSSESQKQIHTDVNMMMNWKTAVVFCSKIIRKWYIQIVEERLELSRLYTSNTSSSNNPNITNPTPNTK